MTYEEFVKALHECYDDAAEYKNEDFLKYNYDTNQHDYIMIRYEVSGAQGGSCWGGEPQSYTNDGPRPEFTNLDKFLEQVCPTISFLQYRRILSMVKTKIDSHNEYYGNYTNYEIKQLSIVELYEYLKDKING